MPTFRSIPQLTERARYRIDQPWEHLEDWLDRSHDSLTRLNLDPDFQRAHVWDTDKQRRYVEYILRGGQSSKELYFNHPNWLGSFRGEMVLVDGKQRLEAVRRFMRNELAIFDGNKRHDYTDRLPLEASFSINVNTLKTRAEILQWYIDLNDGGVAHTSEEIEKVRQMLEQEKQS